MMWYCVVGGIVDGICVDVVWCVGVCMWCDVGCCLLDDVLFW